VIELFGSIRGGYGSKTTEAVEHITGKEPISMIEFANDYSEVFR
jgi:hypothetical protein